MTLQSKTIQRYRLLFPQETLREISARTGIQITRVFRLFNGKPMKVGELEAFEKIINNKIAENPSFARLNYAVEEASTLLTNDELAKLANYLERKIVNKKYSRTYISSLFENASIA
jgi:hypothetical protein